MKVNRLKLNDPSYPAILKNIASPPKELYFLGASPGKWLHKPRVAIVGSRKVSGYGRTVTEKLAEGLARRGVVIISGLALGIDSIAHQAALKAGGLTIAVMPGGLDRVYPASHTNLARQILSAGGALVSEYPPGSSVFKQNFIARNRIVSGLADALLITEAAAASGSLHTANFALEQGRTVMAVPGNITSETSQGTNNLIKSGAVPVTSAEDIFFALNIQPEEHEKSVFSGSPAEEKVLELVRSGTASQEELALALDMDGAELVSVLTFLEISGHIKPAGGGYWLAN
jgi:DNA processing protein